MVRSELLAAVRLKMRLKMSATKDLLNHLRPLSQNVTVNVTIIEYILEDNCHCHRDHEV